MRNLAAFMSLVLSLPVVLMGTATAQGLAPHFSQRTTIYLHGVFGEDFEFARLDAFGQRYDLASPEVFEDRRPRIVDLNHDGRPEILAVVSEAGQGAGLALFGRDARGLLVRLASGPKIGLGHRWQAPLIGQADINGDGIDEVASILTPHINPRLQILSWQGSGLVVLSTRTLPSGSNHAYGSKTLDNAFWCETGGKVVAAVTADPRSQDRWLFFNDLAAGQALQIGQRFGGGLLQARQALGCPVR